MIFEDLVKIRQAVKIQKIADLPGADITAFTIPQKSKNGIAVSKFSMVRNRLPGKATHGQKKRPASNHDDGKNSPLFCQVYRRQDAKRADREKGFDEITAFCLPEHKANKFRFIELLAR